MASSYSSTPASPASSAPSSTGPSSSDSFSASEWTQQSMVSDLLQQKPLLIGMAALVGAILFFRARAPKPEEKAARRLVRDWRKVDDPDDARDLLGSNLPTIMRPALLIAFEEIKRQVHQGFRRLEREISHL